MRNLTFALATEDLPCQAQLDIERQWPLLFKEFMKGGEIRVHSSSRHTFLEALLPDESESIEEIGPPEKGAPQAIAAFKEKRLRCSVKETEKGRRWCGYAPHKSLEKLIPHLCNHLLKNTRFSYAMERWSRPVINASCLYKNRPLVFYLERLGLETEARLFTHPLLKERWVRPDLKLVAELGLITDYEEKIRGLPWKEVEEKYHDLLRENVRSVTSPLPLLLTLDPSDLPDELICLTLTTHQKLVPMKENRYLAVVRRGVDMERSAKNLMRVVRARLEDLRFFYRQDLQKTPAEHLEKLRLRQVFGGLGTYEDKRRRIQAIAQLYVPEVAPAASLLYFDLFTSLVEEFPELEGRAARIYLGDNPLGSVLEGAMWPRQPEAPLEKLSRESLLLAWIKRLDTLVGFALQDRLPSGSGDPLGVRREAMCWIRCGFELVKLPVAWEEVAKKLIELYGIPQSSSEKIVKLQAFLHQRFVYLLRDRPMAREVLAGRDQVWSARERCRHAKPEVAEMQKRIRNLIDPGASYGEKDLGETLPPLKAFYREVEWGAKIPHLLEACAWSKDLLDRVHFQTSPDRDRHGRSLMQVLRATEELLMVS